MKISDFDNPQLITAMILSTGKKEIRISRTAIDDVMTYDFRLEMDRDFDTGSYTIRVIQREDR